VKKEWAQEKPAKARRQDIDARWTKKNDVAHFGYKNHIMVDNAGKFIRDYAVIDASVHDSRQAPASIIVNVCPFFSSMLPIEVIKTVVKRGNRSIS